MTSSARAARNVEIARARAEGESVASIARRLGISETTVRRGDAEHLRAGVDHDPLDQFDGRELLARVINAQLGALDRLEKLAVRPDNTAAGVGAARAISSVGADVIESLIHAGRLPERSESYEFRLHEEALAIARAAGEVMDELGLPAERFGPAIEAQRALAKRVVVGNGGGTG